MSLCDVVGFVDGSVRSRSANEESPANRDDAIIMCKL